MTKTSALVLLVCSLSAATPAWSSPLTNSLIQRWQYAFPVCKGTAADLDAFSKQGAAMSAAACRTRFAIDKELKRRGFCLVSTPNGIDEYDWRSCRGRRSH